MTVFHNGVLVHDKVTLLGSTAQDQPRYAFHPERMPLSLQVHDCSVRYRNIWIRELSEAAPPSLTRRMGHAIRKLQRSTIFFA